MVTLQPLLRVQEHLSEIRAQPLRIMIIPKPPSIIFIAPLLCQADKVKLL